MKLGIISLFIIFNIISNNYLSKTNYKSKNNKKVKKIHKILFYDLLFILSWLLISFIINKTLISNFSKYSDLGLLNYNIQKEINLSPLDESNYYVRAQIDLDNKYRAMLYKLEDGTEISKDLGAGIKINTIDDELYKLETQGNLLYDDFLRAFFFQFYSVSYKQIVINEKYIKYIGGDN